jgi:hypothetical protein
MTLPASGAISLTQVMNELRNANPARAYPISLGDADVRALAGVASGAISLSNLYGKSSGLTVTAPNRFAQRLTNTSGNVSVASTATASGGNGVYTYAWSYVSGDSFSIANGATATATFATTCSPGTVFTGTYKCTVSDGLGVAGSATITVELDGYQL